MANNNSGKKEEKKQFPVGESLVEVSFVDFEVSSGKGTPMVTFKLRGTAGSATDQVIWASDMGEVIAPHRPQDAHFRGNIIQAMVAYAEGQLGAQTVPLKDVTRIIAIGSDGMMNAVRVARHGVLAPHLNPKHVGIGSINSPMQCMMKEVCAQCLQRHVDPETGREEFVFSCYNQDQELDRVDFANLRGRLRQNSVQEKISNLWFEHLLDQAESQLVHV